MDSHKHHPYELLMLVLSILSLASLAIATTGALDPQRASILQFADLVVCGMFFVDFVLSMYRAPNKWRYFLRWGWLDLLSSVPMIDALRITRLARILRVIQLIRGVKATKILAQFILSRRADNAFMAVTLVSLLLVVVSSIAILRFEAVPDSNIKSAGDAVWWAVTTITTTGYGDHYPITTAGRSVAAILMIGGVALFGTLSGFVAAWFLRPSQELRDAEMATLIKEVRELKRRLEP